MNEQLIDYVIEMVKEQKSNAHGSNKKCFLIGDYALLKQSFNTEEIENIIKITEKLAKKGVNVARTLDYKVIKQDIMDYWNDQKNVLVSKGYVLQERAKGTPLLDMTNWNDENKRYQIDYIKQIDSISKEGQDFFNQFVKGWLEIQEAGIQIDPSKPGNFIYEQGKGITFIDLGLSSEKTDISTSVYEQLAVILNLNTYYKCYPEIQQAARERLNVIAEKYKNAIIEQGIDASVFNQVIETRFPERVSEHNKPIEENFEEEIFRLEETINEHIKEEEIKKAEIRKLQAEREEKQIIEREKRDTKTKMLEEEEERKNGKKRKESKMYALLNALIKKGIIPENEAIIYKQIFQVKTNIYSDLNPQLFKKQYMIEDLDDAITNPEHSNIRIDMRNMELESDSEVSEQTYEQIKLSVEEYFKQYFEDIAKNTDTKLLEYSEMKEKQKEGLLNEEEYINFMLLETELYEFSNAKKLFPTLGIKEKETYKKSDEVSAYLQEKNKISEEEKAEIERRRRQTDREFLYEIFKGTGITDPAELRRLYNGQEELRVLEEDLEAVLSMFSDMTNTSNPKVGKKDFKQVAESSIEEKSIAFKLLKLASQEPEKSNNIKSQGE